MNLELDILPTYSENRNVITLIISSPADKPISDDEIADVLVEYANFLTLKGDEVPN